MSDLKFGPAFEYAPGSGVDAGETEEAVRALYRRGIRLRHQEGNISDQ